MPQRKLDFKCIKNNGRVPVLPFLRFRRRQIWHPPGRQKPRPRTRMVPPANVPELRKTLGVFVQSSRFIPNYAHVVRPLTELTRSENGKAVPFTWTQERQDSFDHVQNLLLDGIHLAPPRLPLTFPLRWGRVERPQSVRHLPV